MVAASRPLPLLVALIFARAVAADVLDASPPTLCQLLESIQPGEQREVDVAGVYWVGMEHQILYDPRTPLCSMDVQPATWIEFARGAEVPSEFHELPAERVYVRVKGVLHGPGIVEEDDVSIPVVGSFANRTARDRYGHLNMFRTRLIVYEVLDFAPVPDNLDHYVVLSRPTAGSIPRVLSGGIPEYPERARRAGIKGIIELRVRVEEGTIQGIERISGDRMLAASSEAAIATWSFEAGYSGTFVTTFEYELELRRRGSNSNVKYEMQLPSWVRLIAPADAW